MSKSVAKMSAGRSNSGKVLWCQIFNKKIDKMRDQIIFKQKKMIKNFSLTKI